ncbi:hypothetical protein SEA_HUBBS_97 [Microbacterium phage Hubbs]|nr:hypothetical protein SEA_HUBBS_97 [Microbacterium phage Hubbs]
MAKQGQVTGYHGGRKVNLDTENGDAVVFQVGEDDEKISVSIRHGELHVHSHAWNKQLAAVGEAGNVLRLKVIDR